jgi:hypothetical protein
LAIDRLQHWDPWQEESGRFFHLGHHWLMSNTVETSCSCALKSDVTSFLTVWSTRLRKLLFWFLLLPILGLAPQRAAAARVQNSGAASLLANTATPSRLSALHANEIAHCRSALFESNIRNSEDDDAAVPHHRIRRRALKTGSLRVEPVLLRLAVVRDCTGGSARLVALQPAGRSPPAL